jgi:hypothetical protein
MFPVFKKNKESVIIFAPNTGNDAIFIATSAYDKQKKDLDCIKHTHQTHISIP